MARVVVMGAGVSGHTCAMFVKDYLGKEHEVVVVTPNSKWNWIPSNIWVGVGRMSTEDVTFDLKPVYDKPGITFKQAKAVSVHPEGDAESGPFITVESTAPGSEGTTEKVTYDYLVNATGPKLNFGATEGLGPDKNSLSVCSASHAEHANEKLQEAFAKMERGEKQRFLVGTGHGMCTCQGAAFEYIFNIEHELRTRKIRHMAELQWISNEFELGDFGIGGMHLKRGGYITHSKVFTESLYAERGLKWIVGAHVNKVDPGVAHYENLNGEQKSVEFDFAMLIPPFAGVGIKAFDKEGGDITEKIFAPNGFLKVDANYTAKPYEAWEAEDWPKHYQNQEYKNIFAVGIAFAPPHPISKPMKSVNGTAIFPTPPRTGMPSAMMGKAVAQTLRDMIKKGAKEPTHGNRMSEMAAACVASAGKGWVSGTAASMTMYPIVQDFKKYPEYGRDIDLTFGEVGLAGHWIKTILHYMFLHKAKAGFGWKMIPE